MKKLMNRMGPQTRKLVLQRETLRKLDALQLGQVVGGESTNNCPDTSLCDPTNGSLIGACTAVSFCLLCSA